MKMRTWLEYLTQRSVDSGTAPPAWLRWFQQRDPLLREYASDALELDDLLRVTASARRSELAAGFVSKTEPNALASGYLEGIASDNAPAASAGGSVRVLNSPRYAQFAWFATAAALLAFVVLFNHDPEKQANAERAQLLSTQLAGVPDDMLAALAQAARSSQDYSPLGRLGLPEMNVWSDIPRETQGQLKESLSTWGSQLSALGEHVYEQLDVRAELN